MTKKRLQPGQLHRVLLVSIDAPGHYSLALPLLKGYAESDETIHKTVRIKIVRIDNIGGGTRVLKALLRTIAIFRPQVVGFSCYIWNALMVRRCCRWVRRCFPRTLLLLGGQEICPPLEEVTETYRTAHVLIPGEGEAPFRSLLHALLEHGWEGIEHAKGIHFQGPDGHWHLTSPPPKSPEPSEIPSAYLTGNVQMPDNPQIGAMIELTRGCPMRCGFCYEANRAGPLMRFSFDRVGEEIGWLRRQGHRRFHILDPILCTGRRLQELHEVLRQRDMEGTHVSAEMYAEHIRSEDKDTLQFITDCDVGLQTTSHEALRILQRPWLKEQFERGFAILKEAQKVVSCYLIIGLPGDNLQSFRTSLDYVQGLRPTKLFCNPLLVLRGTALRLRALEHGLQFAPDPPYEALECHSFSRKELDRAKALGALTMNAYNMSRRP